MDNIKSVLDREASHLKIDNRLIKEMTDYKNKFINRSLEHINFFGGNLIGVEVIRFLPTDRKNWFEILKIDEDEVEEKIHSLENVNSSFLVSSDIFNISCVWLTHRILNSTLSKSAKEKASFIVMMIFNIKLITSLMYHYFKYPADPAVARATYAELSNKFTIKQLGSWYKVLESRSNDILDKDGIHAKMLDKFDDDLAIAYSINDIQGRLRDMIKNIYAVFMRIHSQGTKIGTSNNVIEVDGEMVLRDNTRSLSSYTEYIKTILPDKNSFIKVDLVAVIERLMTTMSPTLFNESLNWFSETYGKKHTEDINSAINDLMTHTYDYLDNNQSLLKNTKDIPGLVVRLRGTYMSSRNSDDLLQRTKTEFERLVKLSVKSKSSTAIKAVRTGVMLYVVVRALAMKYYTNSSI